MLQDNDPGKPDTYISEAKVAAEQKVEEKKEPEMKPPEEFIYDPVAQEESH